MRGKYDPQLIRVGDWTDCAINQPEKNENLEAGSSNAPFPVTYPVTHSIMGLAPQGRKGMHRRKTRTRNNEDLKKFFSNVSSRET